MAETKATTIRLPPDVRERIDAYRQQHHCSLSQALTMLAIAGLDRYDQQKANQ